ncbi:MAG: nucleoside deaminase [Spirochaetia bacterium]|nr:nucleoside deaminase [Spirochaetia bacterium]
MTELSERLIKKAFAKAYKEAQKAYEADEVPVGASILYNQKIIAAERNRIREKKDPSAHAELLAIQTAAQKIKNERLSDCILFSTLEPCIMCTGASVLARLRAVYFLAYEDKLPALRIAAELSGLNHKLIYYYYPIEEFNSSKLLKDFFFSKRR